MTQRAVIRSLCAAALLSTMYVPATAFAWDCQAPANKHLAECKPATPTPKMKMKHEKSTPVPEVPTAPTLAPTLAPTSPAPSAPALVVSAGAPINLSEYCHYEPRLARWEIRRTSNSSPQSMGPLPMAPGVCAQNTPVPTSTPLAIPIPAAVATATLYVPVQPPAEDTMPPSGPEPTPSMDDQPPGDEELVPSVPTGLPETGGDDGCSYYETCLED